MKAERITPVIAAVLLALGLTAALATPSHAASGFQYISGLNGQVQVINAWGGGPYVKVYNMAGSTNNDFTGEQNPNTGSYDYIIVFTGNGSWAGHCIGDAGNLSGNADTSLDACPGVGNTGGWGVNFTEGSSGCANGDVWFHDNHWNGYLAGSGEGNELYLNNTAKTCYSVLGAA